MLAGLFSCQPPWLLVAMDKDGTASHSWKSMLKEYNWSVICWKAPFSWRVLCFRNNLTVVDFLLVQGQGTYESLKMAGKPPGPGSSLRFKLTEALLRDCSDSKCELSEAILRDCSDSKCELSLGEQLGQPKLKGGVHETQATRDCCQRKSTSDECVMPQAKKKS